MPDFELDGKVADFRERPLVSAVIATAVNVEGRREIVGFDIVTTESTTALTGFLRSMVARRAVRLIISDAHGGIKAAIAAFITMMMLDRAGINGTGPLGRCAVCTFLDAIVCGRR